MWAFTPREQNEPGNRFRLPYDTEETLGSWCDSDRDAGIALQTRVLASTTHGNSLETLLTVLQPSPQPTATTSGHSPIP